METQHTHLSMSHVPATELGIVGFPIRLQGPGKINF